MSKFLVEKLQSLSAYVPGEQPRDKKYVKLNTNESPFMPAPAVKSAVEKAAADLQLYPDPDCNAMLDRLSAVYGLAKDQLIVCNGSDEILDFAVLAFSDEKHPVYFPDISYGCYPVFSDKYSVPYVTIPLKDDFSIDVEDYLTQDGTVIIANPNAPTGLALSVDAIEKVVAAKKDRVVIVDEAYVDFGTETCLPLINKYDNILVVRTMSKSSSLAGARLGFAAGSKELISDLYRIKYSTNPYNINRMSAAAGYAVLDSREYVEKNCKAIIETRDYASAELRRLGFEMTDSLANFIFVTHPGFKAEELYLKLKDMGVLVRFFGKKRIENYLRITIGTKEEMDVLISCLKQILEG